MDNWDEIRSAAEVARRGTLSGAAESLGVHRTTVHRHIEALEQVLGSPLFLRHGRGYTPTELGHELLRVADATDDQISQLLRRARSYSGSLSGELIVTCVSGLSGLLLPALRSFQEEHPGVRARVLLNERLAKLQYGEAHLALRAGPEPLDPDNVVSLWCTLEFGLFATHSYRQAHGLPQCPADFREHRFVGADSKSPRAPFLAWLSRNVPAENIHVASNDLSLLEAAVLGGSGIGFLPLSLANARNDLALVLPSQPEWSVPIWIVTHVDLHRAEKVQKFLQHLRRVR